MMMTAVMMIIMIVLKIITITMMKMTMAVMFTIMRMIGVRIVAVLPYLLKDLYAGRQKREEREGGIT